MPWKRTDSVSERVKFIARYLEGLQSITDLSNEFEISRKTAYKWIERYECRGIKSLSDQSRRPNAHPHAVSKEVIEKIVLFRKRHPTWGPKKLLVVIKRREPEIYLPAASTVGEILKRNDLIKPRRKRRTSSPYSKRLGGYDSPNAIWCADFKGHFPVGGKRCHPLTITDGFSRYLIRCEGLRKPIHSHVQKVFESAFKEYGMPDAIRTDNGAPFSTLAPGGLSRLSIWWLKLGIRPERIAPGRPDQNGRHERMHLTLKVETAKPPKSNHRLQQSAFDKFQTEYNNVRPHEALGQEVPKSFYKKSERTYPKVLPEIEYPSHMRVEKAYPNGIISIGQTQWYISSCVRNEFVGVEQVNDDVWKVFYGPIELGILDDRNAKRRRDRHFGTLIRTDGQTSGLASKQRRKV